MIYLSLIKVTLEIIFALVIIVYSLFACCVFETSNSV